MADIYKVVVNSKGVQDLQVAKAFLNYICVDSVNKYDTIKQNKFNTKDNGRQYMEMLDDILEDSNFYDVYEKVGYALSADGGGYAFVYARIDDKDYVTAGKIIGVPVQELNKIKSITLDINFNLEKAFDPQPSLPAPNKVLFNYTYDEKEKKVYSYQAKVVNNKVVLDQDTKVYYPMDDIPVVIINNNSLGKPDIPDEVRPLLALWEYIYNIVKAEYELSKTIVTKNGNVNSKSLKEMMGKILDGNRDIDVDTNADTLANSLQINRNDFSGLTHLEALVGWLESKIRLLSHQFRDHGGKELNRNDTSLLLMNQQAYEYMTRKLNFRERQLNRFLKMVWEIITKNKSIGTEKYINYSLAMPDFEQWRYDSIQADVDMKVAQAEQYRGVATKNLSESKVLESGAGTVPPTTVDTNVQVNGGGK